MEFHSILFEKPAEAARRETAEAPGFFTDLNLDQIIDAVTASKAEYDLKPFYYTPLHDIDTIEYRHEVMRDLENETLFAHLKNFEKSMRLMREQLARADKLHSTYQKQRWFLDAAATYGEAVSRLAEDLESIELYSCGLAAFRMHVTRYSTSDSFAALCAETKQLTADLSSIRYCVRIKGNSVRVRRCGLEIDYSMEVEKAFERFEQGAVKSFDFQFSDPPRMNHVEEQILSLVARLFPEIFNRLEEYCTHHAGFADATITAFDREVQFYIAYLEYMSIFRHEGLEFCVPQVSDTRKEVYSSDGFDAALARMLIRQKKPIVLNDFSLNDPERILVVSGPNQGGKTTFARTFGQLHYLASVGLPVPGRKARLFLCDRLFTHFENEENLRDQRGKLQDDLIRMHHILERATTSSIIIINEIFNSTTLHDATYLSREIMERITRLDALAVCVTFIDELASLSEKTVSMVSTIVPENPAERTFKILRWPADGLAYAMSIAEKHRLTSHSIKERIKP
jgi:DNA mismatch repair protein MutS